MDAKQHADSMLLSRASPRVREVIESRQASLTPPPSVSGSPGVQRGFPYSASSVSSILQTDAGPNITTPRDSILTIVYGENFQSKRSISKELLYRHSKVAQACREETKQLRKQYERCVVLKDEFASLAALIESKAYKEKGVEEQIMRLIELVRDHYPLEEYQSRIQDLLEDTADGQCTLGNTKPQHKVKITSRQYKDMVLMSRVRSLNRKGLMVVCDRLIGNFLRVEASEKLKAEKSTAAALAHKQLWLRGSNEESIQSLVAWLEHGRLHYESGKQLYNLYNLSVKLGIDALSGQCANLLYDELSDFLEGENAKGSSLQQLLGFDEAHGRDQSLVDSTPPNSVMRTIFERVLNKAESPQTLSELVSVLLAKHMDLELWQHVKVSIGHEFGLRIIGTMVAQREVKATANIIKGHEVKRENHEVTNA